MDLPQISVIGEEDLGLIRHRFSSRDMKGYQDWITQYNWSPSTFESKKDHDVPRRDNQHFEKCGLLVLDIDNDATIEFALTEFKEYKHIIATTKSHGIEKNGVTCDRFRVILFLDRPITDVDQYYHNWQLAYDKWPFIDKACKDPARFYYPCKEVVSVNETGKLISVHDAPAVLPAAPVIQSTVSTPVGRGQLTNRALEFLALGAPAGHWHTEFLYTASCLKEQGYDELEALFMLEKITGELDKTDHYQLTDIYKRPSKYEFVPKEDEPEPLFIKASDLMNESMTYLKDKDKVYGEPTGFAPLDKLLGGGRRLGEITALMAEAKTGKNTLLHWLLPKTLNKGIAWGYASRELSPAEEVIPNLLTIETGVNFWNAEVDDELETKARGILADWSLYFAPGYGVFPVDEIERWFRAMSQVGVKYFLFDHFHHALLTEDYKETSILAKTLKKLVKELNIYLEIIIQPRGLHQNEKLGLATLRGGKVIGQAIDNLLILQRVPGEKNISELVLSDARSKLARPGKVLIEYDPDTTSFREVRKEYGENPNKNLSIVEPS